MVDIDNKQEFMYAGEQYVDMYAIEVIAQ